MRRKAGANPTYDDLGIYNYNSGVVVGQSVLKLGEIFFILKTRYAIHAVVTHDRSIGSWIFYFGGDSFISFY
jgi:hypothetical protein